MGISSRIFSRGGVAASFLAATLLAGCTSTSLVNMWKDPARPRTPLHNVLVVNLRQNSASRRLWEDGFVSALKDRGVSAVPSYEIFPAGAPDTTELVAAVKQHGYDAILLSHRLSVDTTRQWVHGYVTTEPVTYISPWTGRYYTYWADVHQSGYLESDQVIRYEAEVWMTAGAGHLVWTGTTESVNPSSGSQVNHEIAATIVPELLRAGVITGK